MSQAVEAALCPVCGEEPSWCPSMIRSAESIGCNLEDHCPRPSFGFQTPYLPVPEAIEMWNAAVARWPVRPKYDGTASGQARTHKESDHG